MHLSVTEKDKLHAIKPPADQLKTHKLEMVLEIPYKTAGKITHWVKDVEYQ